MKLALITMSFYIITAVAIMFPLAITENTSVSGEESSSSIPQEHIEYFTKMEKYCLDEIKRLSFFDDHVNRDPIDLVIAESKARAEWIKIAIQCRKNLIRLQKTKNGNQPS